MLKKSTLTVLLFSVTLFASKGMAFAEDRIVKREEEGCILTETNAPSLGCLSQVIVSVINVAFIFLGAACLIFLLWGALQFVISRGDPKAVQKAQGTMTYAVIGTIFVVLTFVAVSIISAMLGLPNMMQNFNIYQGSPP